jgi:hypothetical protein
MFRRSRFPGSTKRCWRRSEGVSGFPKRSPRGRQREDCTGRTFESTNSPDSRSASDNRTRARGTVPRNGLRTKHFDFFRVDGRSTGRVDRSEDCIGHIDTMTGRFQAGIGPRAHGRIYGKSRKFTVGANPAGGTSIDGTGAAGPLAPAVSGWGNSFHRKASEMRPAPEKGPRNNRAFRALKRRAAGLSFKRGTPKDFRLSGVAAESRSSDDPFPIRHSRRALRGVSSR